MKRFLVLFALNEITKCEINDVKIWNNNEPENNWSNSINNDESGNAWNKKEPHKNSWKNDHDYNYETKYKDHNVGYGYHIRNKDAEVWVHSYPSDKHSWSINNNLNGGSGSHQQNNNGWNDNQSPWNTPQGSQPEPYFYPRPSQPLTTEAPSMSSATTVLPKTSESVENNEQYVPQTNFYSQNEPPNKIQSSFDQFPVFDLTKNQGNSPQKEIVVMESKPIKEDFPEEDMMSLPINALSAASFPQSGFNIGHQNLVQVPFLQAYQQSPNGFSNIQSMSTNNQQNLGTFLNVLQNNPFPYTQSSGNFPDVTAQQNPFGIINAPQGLTNNPFNVQNVNPFAEIIPPFNSNRPNENGPIKTETTLSVQGNLQNAFNSAPIQVNNGIPENILNQGNFQFLNSPPLIQVPISQNSQQPTFDNHLSIQSKIPIVLQPNAPQPQQFLLQNSFLPQFNSFQQPSNVNAHPGYNNGPIGYPWMNLNAVQQIPVDSDVSGNKVRRSINLNEDDSDEIYDLVDRPWFNGHGYGYANNEDRGIDTIDKSEDFSKITAMENMESTTTKDMNMINDKISSKITKDDTKIVDLK